MSDIVERLRNAIHPVIQTEEEAIRMEAADEIERLREIIRAVEEELFDDDVAEAQLILKHRND